MSQFGFSIEYTLSRTYPAFMYLNRLIDRVRADATIDGVYAGYTAGKYGEKIADKLFEKRGSFHINKKNKTKCTKEDVERAIKRAKKHIRKYKKNV